MRSQADHSGSDAAGQFPYFSGCGPDGDHNQQPSLLRDNARTEKTAAMRQGAVGGARRATDPFGIQELYPERTVVALVAAWLTYAPGYAGGVP